MPLKLPGEFFPPELQVINEKLIKLLSNRAGLNDWIYERSQKASA